MNNVTESVFRLSDVINSSEHISHFKESLLLLCFLLHDTDF